MVMFLLQPSRVSLKPDFNLKKRMSFVLKRWIEVGKEGEEGEEYLETIFWILD